jgi:hypothetical protein
MAGYCIVLIIVRYSVILVQFKCNEICVRELCREVCIHIWKLRLTFLRCVLHPSPWWWRQYAPLKHRSTSTRLRRENIESHRFLTYSHPFFVKGFSLYSFCDSNKTAYMYSLLNIPNFSSVSWQRCIYYMDLNSRSWFQSVLVAVRREVTWWNMSFSQCLAYSCLMLYRIRSASVLGESANG